VVLLSVAIGTFAARRAGRPSDVVVRAVTYSTWSIPAFLLALLLQELFARLALRHHWQPLYVVGVPGPEAGTGFHFVLDWIRHLTLPVVSLAVGFVGAYSRYVRSAMLVSLGAAYTTTARAKGLTERRVTVGHALHNSLIPFVNVLAFDFGAIFGASLAVDFVFDQHGLASFLVQGLFNSDPYEVEPVILIAAGIVLLSRAFAGVVTARLDPVHDLLRRSRESG
jgi:peptide/nickel transport system permease protein